MPEATTVLNQLQHILPLQEFQGFVNVNKADKYTKKLSCKDQLTILLYAQATGKNSLREIEMALRIQDSIWYHLGLETVARSTLAAANEKRPYGIYESLFYELLKKCKGFSSGTASFSFDNELYAIDSTTVDLCLSLFPWAHFRTEKGAIKLHTLFNVRDQIPELILVTDGKEADITMARKMDLHKLAIGSIITFDRGYNDYAFLYAIQKAKQTFVARAKDNANILALESFPVTEKGVLKDERIGFVLDEALKDYPDDLRLVTYHDEVHNKTYHFLTNNFLFSAKTIADIYKARWQIELFFKWIKQHLKIKTFLGTSKNAVLTQIWVAMIYYLLLAWIRFQTKFKGSLLDLTWIIKEMLLRNISIVNLLNLSPKIAAQIATRASPSQLVLL
jgi:hypothetical protein